MAVPQKIKNRITIRYSNCTLGYIPRGTEIRVSKRHLNTHVYSSIIHDRMWYIHTVEYYSTFKRKETMTHTTTWVNLQDIILSGIRTNIV